MRRLLAGLFRVISLLFVLGLLAGGVFLYSEFKTNARQAQWLAEFAGSIDFWVDEGPNPNVLPPDTGPFDQRLGYSLVPQIGQRLEQKGFEVTHQARLSRRHEELVEHGLFHIYDEKTEAGLQVLDHHGRAMYQRSYPLQTYPDFESVPALVLLSLSFVEDRELLDFSQPYRNPVVDWERLAKAVVMRLEQMARGEGRSIGASTVATQLEKFRHSPGGITSDSKDKAQQMASALMRVYRHGPDTTQIRKELALAYLNAMPLAALKGFGEVNGMGDGLEAWYGSDFDEVNRVLGDAEASPELQGLYFKQVLSLVLSVRRPSFYLGKDRTALENLTNSYLRRMGSLGAISEPLRDAALKASLVRRSTASPTDRIDYTREKGVNLVRTRLLSLLDVDNFYALDRLDLTATSSIDAEVQAGVTQFLRGLGTRERIAELGLTGDRLMSASDPGKVVYSFTLYERDGQGNHLRVNADNLDRPFDVNAGARLDLGSTSKLRTMVTWLELIADVYDRVKQANGSGAAIELHPKDRLSAWVVEHVAANPGDDLSATLRAAMQRVYSANPNASFYTGGGVHTFANFEKADNSRQLTVAEALRRSVNLVFIRMMREVVDHYLYRLPGSLARVLEQPDDPQRADYLRRFADREGSLYLSRFYKKYVGKTRRESVELLLDGINPKPRSLTVILRALSEIYSAEELAPWLKRYVPTETFSDKDVEKLFDKYDPAQWDLNDLGYLARVHPLELWLLQYLAINPNASVSEALAASTEVRQDVYRWLIKTHRRKAQDRRILDLLEIEAFEQIHASWQRLGYPFASLTPSLATSIGSSGDRPAALARLMGIIISDGMLTSSTLVESLDVATGTPYETRFAMSAPTSEQVLRPEVARVAREGLEDVVANGTARALLPSLKTADGVQHVAGGKTGTGDHRYEVYAGRGKLIESRVVNRVATFMFHIDGRFYGTITAFVAGPDAADYKFTSGLPVRLLGALMPTLEPLLEE